MRFWLFWAAIFAGVMLLTPADAQLAPQWQSCTGKSDVDWDQQIRSCSTLIQSRRETTLNRAAAYSNRGVAYRAKGDLDRAMADYNEAIRLDPKYAFAFNNRGIAYRAKGDLDRAIADSSEAIRLDPKYAIAFNTRGVAYGDKGDLDRAMADYNEAIRLDPKYAQAFNNRGRVNFYMANYGTAATDFARVVQDSRTDAYAVLWLYLARVRSGNQTAATELETNATKLKQPDWPYPMVSLFLGQRTAEATVAAATKAGDRCEAQFYAGAWFLMRGDRAAALERLKTAAAEPCAKTDPEFDWAKAELKRLGQ